MAQSKQPNARYDWVVHDLSTGESRVVPWNEESDRLLNQPNVLVYGTQSIGANGCGYLVGWRPIPTGFEPYAFEVAWGRGVE